MKSLILKDFYNIGHNLKSMLFILIVFAFAVIPFSGTSSYIFICAILCSMMIVTTFTFDDSSHWLRYALILPITKKDIVLAKFVTLFIFSSLGSLFGLILGFVGGIIINDVGFNSYDILELLLIALVALVIAMIFGGMSIPLVLKFGAEKGRLLLMVSFLLPAGLFWGIYQLLMLLGVKLSQDVLFVFLCCSPLIAFIWDYIMYKISIRVFDKRKN